MPAYQTSYAVNQAAGYPGMVADGEFTTNMAYEIQTAAAGFGLAVGRGSADRTAKINGAGYVGVTIANKAALNAAGTGYAVGEIAAVMTKGSIWVTAGAAVTPADTVLFAAATGVISNIAAGGTAIPNARFLTTAANGALVQLQLL